MDRRDPARGRVRRIGLIAALALAFGAGAPASAADPVVALDVAAPATSTAGEGYVYTVSYTVTGSNLDQVKIVVRVPAGLRVVATSGPPGTDATCLPGAMGGFACTFQLNLDAGGISGQVLVNVESTRFEVPDGTEMEAVATFDAIHQQDDGTWMPIPTVEGSATTVIHAEPAPGLSGKALLPLWQSEPDTGEAGLRYVLEVRVQNVYPATAPLEPGWTLTSQLPAALHFIAWASDQAYSLSSAPPAWQNGTVVLEGDEPLTGIWYAELDVWIPCSELPLTAGSVDSEWRIDGTEETAAGDEPWVVTATLGPVPEPATFSCAGTPGESEIAPVNKRSVPGATTGLGRRVEWFLTVWPLGGAYPITDAVVVDAIPPLIPYDGTEITWDPPDFDLYYCDLPQAPGVFDAETFLASYAPDCTTVAGAIAHPTHLVWHAPVWGSAVGIGSFTAHYAGRARVFADDGAVAVNTARYSSLSQTYAISVADEIQIEAWGAVDHTHLTSGGNAPLEPGDPLTITVAAGASSTGSDVINPVVTYTLPPGVAYVGSTLLPFDDTCPWDPPPADFSAKPSITKGPEGETILVWTFGNAAVPAFLPEKCGPPHSNGPLTIEIECRIDETYPWTNGEVFQLAVDIDGFNVTTADHSTVERFVAVPAEMWTAVEPSCTSNGGNAFAVLWRNTGGTVLTELNVTFPIPRAGDGSGGDVDLAFVSLEGLPPGVLVEYEVGGAWQADPPADPSLVTALRFTETMVQPGESRRLVLVEVAFPEGTAEGEPSYGRSTIDSSVLPAVTSVASARLEMQICPGRLEVLVYFDADGDGERDEGEPGLDDWSLQLTAVDESWEGWRETAGGGLVDVWLPTGDYQLVATAPDGEATWPIQQATTAIVGSEPAFVAFPVTCHCWQLGTCLLLLGAECPPTGTVITGTPNPDGSGELCFGVDLDGDGVVDTTEQIADTAGTIVFECRLDGGDWYECEGCVPPFDDLPDGEHTFEVRAKDPDGEVDPNPASWAWTVESEAPLDTEVKSGPDAPLPAGGAATFTYERPGAPDHQTFYCRLDGGEWQPCDGGASTWDGLSAGDHLFEVAAADPETGDRDESPAQWAFSVSESACPDDATAPALSCGEGIRLECEEGGALFSAELFPPEASDPCGVISVDAALPGGGTSATLPLGETIVTWTAVDGNGNEASCEGVVTISDTLPPALSCPENVALTTPPDACQVVAELDPPVATDACDGPLPATSADLAGSLPIGQRIVTWKVQDQAGHQAFCGTVVTVSDETPPQVDCGGGGEVAPGAVVTARATDACGATLVLEDLSCRLDGQDVSCPASLDGPRLEVASEGLPEGGGTLSLAWTASATDPSENLSEVPCAATITLSGGPEPSVEPGPEPEPEAEPERADAGPEKADAGDLQIDAPAVPSKTTSRVRGGGCDAGPGSNVSWLAVALALLWAVRRSRYGPTSTPRRASRLPSAR